MRGSQARLNGISMRDYVYAACARQQIGDTGHVRSLDSGEAEGARERAKEGGGLWVAARFIMPNAYVHYLFIK